MSEPDKTDEITNKAIAALHAKGVSAKCPRCEQTQWQATVTRIVVTTFEESIFPASPKNYPVAVIVCMNCGWMAMHHLRVLGVHE
jgi:predicted nucleic-acid-binding Zn-ribbon protein